MANTLNKEKQQINTLMNAIVIQNYSKLKLSLFLLPLFLLASIVLFLYSQDALSVAKYVEIQKDFFIFLNSKLSQYPITEYNLTQVGDALIFLSLLTLLIVYAPKVWESLLSGSIISGIFSTVLKKIISVPRPATALDRNSFVIIGRTVPGFRSLPSGHSITVFSILTILLFAFMPKKMQNKILWGIFIISIGLILVTTRVGVGAHFPLDVISGSIIGYISGLLGIFISRKYKIWAWINSKKYYPVFIVLLLVCIAIVLNRIVTMNLIVFYVTFLCLIVSLYKIIYVYVKK